MTKENVMEAISHMPENFHLDQLFERLVVIEKIDEALQDMAEGRVYTNEEARQHIENIKNGRFNLDA